MHAEQHCPNLPAPLRPVFASNGIHLLDADGRALVVFSPEQLVLLGALRRGRVTDPGAVLGYPPDRRLAPGGPARTPAQRAALSRALRRLADRGLMPYRRGGQWLHLTPLGESYADWLLPMVQRMAKSAATLSVRWVAQVHATFGVSEVG
jgi:hypothetical protein